jgi:hypothetical protein
MIKYLTIAQQILSGFKGSELSPVVDNPPLGLWGNELDLCIHGSTLKLMIS